MLHRHAQRIGYLALAWAIISALPRIYWGMGGRWGVRTLPQIWRDVFAGRPDIVPPEFGMTDVALLFLLIALAVAVAIFPWGDIVPHPVQVAALAISAGFVLFYGVLGFLTSLLMVAGVIDTPASIGESGARWATFMWEPWMILGGVLLALTTRACHGHHLAGTS